MNIVVANGPGKLDDGREVILFPSRWDSAVPGRKPFAFYPYELGILAALLKRELPDARTTFVDGNLEGWDGDTYATRLAALQPDVLITECSALTYPTMTRVMRQVGAARTLLCGPMGAYDWQTHVRDGWTRAITGEYELEVLAILGGTIPPHARTPSGYIDLDWLPWAEDTNVSRCDPRYHEINHRATQGMVQLYATRGCPLGCTFCVVPTYYGGHGKSHKSHRGRNVEDVCDEIEYLAAKYPAFRGCYFNEEAHNANADWLASFCETLIRRGLNRYQYDAMCGAWTMTADLVALMARAGYVQVRFGVESTSERVGRAIRKTIHRDLIENLLGWLKAHHMDAYITLQVGAPGSSEATDRQTVADARGWIQRGLVQRWQLSTSTPQPGTPFWEQARQNGWLQTEDINRLDGYYPALGYPDYPQERIWQVRMEAGL